MSRFKAIEITNFNDCIGCPFRYDKTEENKDYMMCGQLSQVIKEHGIAFNIEYREKDKGVLKNCPFLKTSEITSENVKSIFADAYLGKPYRTSTDNKVIYIRSFINNGSRHLVTNGEIEYAVDDQGKVDQGIYHYGEDIVGEWFHQWPGDWTVETKELVCDILQDIDNFERQNFSCNGLTKRLKERYGR